MNRSINLSNNQENFNDWLLIIENVGVDLDVKSKDPNNIILEGVCAVFGKVNNNKRVYEKEEYLPHLSYLKDKIAKRQLVGDLDHPPHFDVTLKSASHIIEELRYDGADKVFIKLRILEDTPNGKIAKALINGGVNLSISSRAAGQVLNEGKVRLHKIFTYDLVGQPGFTEAVLRKTVNESLKSAFEMITESYESLKHNSLIETRHLVNVSESLNFADNFKVYQINKNDKKLKSVFETDLTNQKNNNAMGDNFVTKEQMNQYSEIIKQQIQGIKKEIKTLNESALNKPAENNSDVDMTKVYGFINYLAEHLEGVINFTDYLSGKVNESIKYSEHIASIANNGIDYANYLGEKLNQSINHQDYIAEKLNQTINYAEYIKENVNKGIKYMNYISEEVDNALQYAEYVAEGTNAGLEFGNYLAEQLNNNRDYSEYIAEKLTQNIGYAEYIAKSINEGTVTPTKRNVLGSVVKVDDLVSKVDEAILTIKSKSANDTLEAKYPFLKVLGEDNKKKFYALDNETKQSIVETLGVAIWFNEADVVSIMEAVVSEKTKTLPNHIKFMPAEYKATWSQMTESEQNRIHAKAQLYKITTPYQAKAFWDEQDLRGINERVEIEKNNLKNMQKLNESQSTEGHIPVDQVVEMQRGYSQDYMNSLLRGASYRK